MAIQKAEAFVLRSQPFRSSSLVVTFFSRQFGKLKGVAKGVRKEALAHPSSYEPFTLAEVVFYEKLRSDLHLISEVSILESFEGLRSNLEALAAAYYLAELVDQLTEPHDSHEKIFELLDFAFRNLPTLDSHFVTRFFEIQLLSEIGLLPNLEGCLGCGEPLAEKFYFSARQGGLFCPNCRKKAPDAGNISLETVRNLKLLMGKPSFEGKFGMEDVGQLIDRFMTERLNKRPITKRFLHQVRALKGRKATV